MIEELWPNGPRFIYADDVINPGIDSILLANFAKISNTRKKKRVIDLGCGSGIIPILLAFGNDSIQVDAIELQPHAVRLANENAELNGISSRIKVLEGDVRHHREYYDRGFFDVSISNPPYYGQGRGKDSANSRIATARVEKTCSIEDICIAAAYLTRWGGSFFLVHLPQRLTEVLLSLKAADLEPKRLKFVHHNIKAQPSLVLIESRRGGKPSLTVEAPLLITNLDGSDTEEMTKIFRR